VDEAAEHPRSSITAKQKAELEGEIRLALGPQDDDSDAAANCC